MRKTAMKELQEAVPADLAVEAEFVDADELLDAVPAEILQEQPVELLQEQHAEAAELLQEQHAVAAELLHEQPVDIGDADERLDAVPAEIQQDNPVELRQEQHAEAAELLQEQLAMAAELLHEQPVDIGDADEVLGAVPAKLAVAAEQVDAAPPLSPRSRPLSSRCRGPW